MQSKLESINSRVLMDWWLSIKMNPIELSQHGARWQALLGASHGEAQRQVLDVLKDHRASPDSICTALKSWRRAMVLGAQKGDVPDALASALN